MQLSEEAYYKSPPASLEAEQAVIGGIIADPSALVIVMNKGLKPTHFYKSAHRLIYEAAQGLFADGSPVDLVSVSDKLRLEGTLDRCGGRAYLTDVALAVITTVNIAHHAQAVQDKALLRGLIQAAATIQEEAYDSVDAKETLGNSLSLLNQLYSTGQLHQDKSFPVLLEEASKALSEKTAAPLGVTGYPTGIEDIDIILGGLKPSRLYIVAGRPGTGKTAYSLNVAKSVLEQGHGVLFFSIEMDPVELAERLIVLEGGGYSPEHIRRAVEALSHRKMVIADCYQLSVGEMKARVALENSRIEGGIGFIVVDYLQLMTEAGYGPGQRVAEVSAITVGLKRLARQLKIPVMALAQLSRAVESRQDKRPMLSDLRESGSIEQDADVVQFLYREDYYNKEAPKGFAENIIAKNRNGALGTVKMVFRPEHFKFSEMVEPSMSWRNGNGSTI